MILQVLSDLHVEFHRDLGRSFINSMDSTGVDVLVIAGDLIPLKDKSAAHEVFSLLCTKYRDSAVLFTPGNHEFYGMPSIDAGLSYLHELELEFDNLTILENKLVRLCGFDFVGTTLWFDYTPERDYPVSNLLNDFTLIGKFKDDVKKYHEKAINFLDWHTTPNSIVVTHHFPLPNSIHQQYANSQINQFFGCDLSELITATKPKLWVHGHTHSSFNYKFDKTHIMCNPFGYLAYDSNAEFITNLRIHT